MADVNGGWFVSEQPLCAPGMHWYVLRVASNKEEQVRDTLTRKVAIEGLQERIGRILVPTLKERRMKGGKATIHERKLYPGYVFVEMACEDDGTVDEHVWFVIKETTGVGDFIGSDGKPTSAMPDHDVVGMLAASEKAEEEPSLGGWISTRARWSRSPTGASRASRARWTPSTRSAG